MSDGIHVAERTSGNYCKETALREREIDMPNDIEIKLEYFTFTTKHDNVNQNRKINQLHKKNK